MRILFLLTQLESGGAQTRVVQTAAKARELGHNADLAFIYEKRECFQDVEKIILGRGSSTSARLITGITHLFRLLRHRRYDAIITNTAPANIIGNTAAMICGIKTRVAYQTQPPARISKLYRILDRCAGSLGIYTKNIVNSEWTRSCFSSYPKNYKEKLELIYDGIEPPSTPRSRIDCRQRIGVNDAEFVILNVGRLSRQKDQATLIKAMNKTKGTLYIIGDGELKSELEQLAKAQAPGRVNFIGEVDRTTLAEYLNAADVFCFSSLWETFGLALVEAASAGLPLVVSDLPVSREVLQLNDASSQHVAFVPPGAENEFADQLNLVRASQIVRSKHSELTTKFSIESHTKELLLACVS